VRKKKLLLFGILAAGLVSCSGPVLSDSVKSAYQALPDQLDFNRDIKPILSDKCFICHGPDRDKVAAGLQLHLPELAYKELKDSPGAYAIVPGNPTKSRLVDRILTEDPDLIMPKPESHLVLTDREKAILYKWISDGAEYKEHWSFIPPTRNDLSQMVLNDGLNPIDHFIQKRLVEENLDFSEQATKEILLRRVSFDLTGLPPSLEEIDAFIKDNSPDAYEKQVDRLLASPHYGEQMTLDWMDVSRYADTHGYTVDRYRDVSPWRDWVIASFNANRPYDEFIEWQVAGDLLPNATREQILATTFNRLHPQNAEGGIIDAEFMSEYVADRTNVTGEAFMGLTVSCAKCHDHKYDPISQKNYYELYSFFNNVNESGQISFDWSMPPPNLLLPTQKQEQLFAYLDSIAEKKKEDLELFEIAETTSAQNWVRAHSYQNMESNALPTGLVAQMDFNSRTLTNSVSPQKKGKMGRQYSKKEHPVFTEGYKGAGLAMDGDAWLDMGGVGVFQRHQPFTIGIRIILPDSLKNGVIFHKGIGAKLYNFKGYHLALKENRLELVMAHLHPGNAIIKETEAVVPKNKWIQLTMTYDGSSKASGLRIFLDGRELKTKALVDNLYKDIVFNAQAHATRDVPQDPGLQIGARWRGKGIGLAVVDDIVVFDRELSLLEIWQIGAPKSAEKLMKKTPGQLSGEEKKLLYDYYLNTLSNRLRTQKKELEKVRKRYVDSMDRVQEIMVIQEMEVPRKTYVLERGQYDVHGEEVFPKTPERIFPFPDSLPKNRLGLAKWLTHRNHPLTARVAVNRYWQRFFGTGIVKTIEDFGNQGELPSHPELLDWLALQFIESGWDVKALHKLMVMSRTYRQNSLSTKVHLEKDPENRLLARGPSKRLSGEMLRNNALASSGLLNRTIGGKSVRPYQPTGLWEINGATYKEDRGEKLYRKSMYTIWKRSVPHPTLATFDAPDRSFCTVRRQETNTPLQALVLLNDPTYIEAARLLGVQMAAFEDSSQAVAQTFRKLTGRTIGAEELTVLTELGEEEYSNFRLEPKKMQGWLTTGDFKLKKRGNEAKIAAFAVVASTILNSDATIMKR